MICLPCNFRCWPSRYTWIHRSKSYPKTSVIKTRRQSFDPQTRPNQIKSLKLTTTPPRRQVPDKTHVHMHPSWSPRVLDSDHWHHTPDWPSSKGILSQFKYLLPTTNLTTLQGTTPPRRQVPDKTHVHMYPSWSPRVLDSDHWHHTPRWPSVKGILSQFNSLPPTTNPAPYTGPLLAGDRYQTRPMSACTQADPLEF